MLFPLLSVLTFVACVRYIECRTHFGEPEPGQHHTSKKAIHLKFGDRTLEYMDTVVQDLLREPNLWPPVQNISSKHPYFFFHQRKAGGSSLRDLLAKSAKNQSVKSYIPCYNRLPCDTVTLPTVKCVGDAFYKLPKTKRKYRKKKTIVPNATADGAPINVAISSRARRATLRTIEKPLAKPLRTLPVGTPPTRVRRAKKVPGKIISCDDELKAAPVVYGGHFPWGEPQNKFERLRHSSTASRDFSCATNFREPFSRVASCLYMRHPQMGKVCVADMDTKSLDYYLHLPDAYGNSCLNEPFRMMSGIRTDIFADHLDVCAPHARSEKVGNAVFGPHPDFLIALTLTLKHIMKCSPLILEVPDTYNMAQQRFKTAGIRFLKHDGNLMVDTEYKDLGLQLMNAMEKLGLTSVNASSRTFDCGNKTEHPWKYENLRLMMCVTAVEQILYRAVKQKAMCVDKGIDPSVCGQEFRTMDVSPFFN